MDPKGRDPNGEIFAASYLSNDNDNYVKIVVLELAAWFRCAGSAQKPLLCLWESHMCAHSEPQTHFADLETTEFSPWTV